MNDDEWERWYAPHEGIDEHASMLIGWAFIGLVLWAVIGLTVWWAIS